MIKTSFLNAQKLPLVIEPESGASFEELIEAITKQLDFLHAQLLRYGAFLLRGFQIEDVTDFERFARMFSGKDPFNYAGGVSPRRILKDGVYRSTEYPAQFGLSLHNELSYSNIYPNHLFFGCLIAPEIGGETTLGDSRRILQKIDRKFWTRSNEKNFVTYAICKPIKVRVTPGRKRLNATIKKKSRKSVERRMRILCGKTTAL